MYPVQKELRDAKMAQVGLALTHQVVLTCVLMSVAKTSGRVVYCCSCSWHAAQQYRVWGATVLTNKRSVGSCL
jgi:hypothetical protein